MSENINILSSEIMAYPEMCYDFEKAYVTGVFERIVHVLMCIDIIPIESGSVIEIKQSIIVGSQVAFVPGWMVWLLRQHRYKNKLQIHTQNDEWHYARVFLHKCIDESVRRTRERIDRRYRGVQCVMQILESASFIRYFELVDIPVPGNEHIIGVGPDFSKPKYPTYRQ